MWEFNGLQVDPLPLLPGSPRYPEHPPQSTLNILERSSLTPVAPSLGSSLQEEPMRKRLVGGGKASVCMCVCIYVNMQA